MGRIIDKISIILLTVFVMGQLFHGHFLIIMVYASIAAAAVNYYLLTRDRSDFSMKPNDIKETISFIFTIAGSFVTILFPQTSISIPNLQIGRAHV